MARTAALPCLRVVTPGLSLNRMALVCFGFVRSLLIRTLKKTVGASGELLRHLRDLVVEKPIAVELKRVSRFWATWGYPSLVVIIFAIASGRRRR